MIKANEMHCFSTLFGNNSTCFEQTYCPSSGVLILYSQQLVFAILVMLTASCSIPTSLADRQHNCMTNTSCCEYSIKTPDDGH